MRRFLGIFIALVLTAGSANAVMVGYARNLAVAPAAPSFTNWTSVPAQLTGTWGASAGATSYNLYVRAGSDPTIGTYDFKYSGVTSPYTINGPLTGGTTYHARVTAVNGAGESALSGTLTATAAAAVAIANGSFETAYNATTDWGVATSYTDSGFCGEDGESPCGDIATSLRSSTGMAATDGGWFHIIGVASGSAPAEGMVSQTMTGANLRAASGTLAFSVAADHASLGDESLVAFRVGFEAFDAGNTLISVSDGQHLLTIMGDYTSFSNSSAIRLPSYAAVTWVPVSFDFKSHVSTHLVPGKNLTDIDHISLQFTAVSSEFSASPVSATLYEFYVDSVVY